MLFQHNAYTIFTEIMMSADSRSSDWLMLEGSRTGGKEDGRGRIGELSAGTKGNGREQKRRTSRWLFLAGRLLLVWLIHSL